MLNPLLSQLGLFSSALQATPQYGQQMSQPMAGNGVIGQVYNQALGNQATPEQQAFAMQQMQQLGMTGFNQPSPNYANSGTPSYSIGGQTYGGSNPAMQQPIGGIVQAGMGQPIKQPFGGINPNIVNPIRPGMQQGNFNPFGMVNQPFRGFSRFPDYQQQGYGQSVQQQNKPMQQLNLPRNHPSSLK